MKKFTFLPLALLALLLSAFYAASSNAAELRVGTANVDITPKKSVPLWGQFGFRPSRGVKSPLTTNVCAVEAVSEDGSTDAAVFASLDVLQIPDGFAKQIRDKAVAKEPTIKPEKIILFATHTHTAPTLKVAAKLPKNDELEDYSETIDNMSTLVADAIVSAWKGRVPADFSWGLEQVSIGWSRRACYFDGSAQMYGNSNDPNFSHYENPSDPDLGTLFFWNKDGELLSVVVNVACTAQVVEGLSVICSDYWNPTRALLNERLGADVVVVAAISPAGDVAPHPQYRQAALARMRELRGLDEMSEIARQIDAAVAASYEVAVKDKKSDVPFACETKTLELTRRIVTDAEYAEAKAEVEKVQKTLRDNPDKSEAEVAFMGSSWHGNVVQRYEKKRDGIDEGPYFANVSVVRLGEVVVATNPFELYIDYGTRIKARSPATATFLIQLAGSGTYLPTEKAVKGGGYSAVVQSCPVDAKGGQELVEGTLEAIQGVWK